MLVKMLVDQHLTNILLTPTVVMNFTVAPLMLA